jgi:hypothetical protein
VPFNAEVTLVANTPQVINLPEGYEQATIEILATPATVYYSSDGSTPTVGGVTDDFIPAVVGATATVQWSSEEQEPGEIPSNRVITLISSGTPQVGISAGG